MVVVGSPAATIFITNCNKLITIIRIEATRPMCFKNSNLQIDSKVKTCKEYPYKRHEIYLYFAALLSFVPFLLVFMYFNGLVICNCSIMIIMMLLLSAQLIFVFSTFKEFLIPYAVIFFIEFLVFLSLLIRRSDKQQLLNKALEQLHINNAHCIYVNFVFYLFLFVVFMIVCLQLLVENQLNSLKIDIDFDSMLKEDFSIKNKLIFYSRLKYVYRAIYIVFGIMAAIFGLPKI